MRGFPGDSVVKTLPAKRGDIGSISGLGRYPGGENGNPLQYSCLENPMDGGALWATAHGIAKSRPQLSDLTFIDTIGLPRWLSGKESACQSRRCRFDPWVRKIPPGKEMASHSSSLVWEIPRKENSGGLQFMGTQKSWT